MSLDGSIHSVLLDFQRKQLPHRRSDDSQNGTDSFLFLRPRGSGPGLRKRIGRPKDAN